MRVNENFIVKKIGNELVLVPIGSMSVSLKAILTLNETSLTVYEMIKEGKNKEEIINKLVEEYEVSVEQVTNDVNKLIARFVELGVIYE